MAESNPQPEQTTAPRTSSTAAPAIADGLLGSLRGTSACRDESNDVVIEASFAARPPEYFDLLNVELTVSDSNLEVRWDTDGPFPTDIEEPGASEVEFGSYAVVLLTEDAEFLPADEASRRLRLIVDILDEGVQVGHQVAGAPYSAQGEVSFTSSTMTATYALRDLGEMPAAFTWNAFTEVVLRENASDPGSNLAIANDFACPMLIDGGAQFPQN